MRGFHRPHDGVGAAFASRTRTCCPCNGFVRAPHICPPPVRRRRARRAISVRFYASSSWRLPKSSISLAVPLGLSRLL